MLEIENRKRGIGVGGVGSGWGRGGNVGRRWDVNVFFFCHRGQRGDDLFGPSSTLTGKIVFPSQTLRADRLLLGKTDDGRCGTSIVGVGWGG